MIAHPGVSLSAAKPAAEAAHEAAGEAEEVEAALHLVTREAAAGAGAEAELRSQVLPNKAVSCQRIFSSLGASASRDATLHACTFCGA